MRRVKVNNLIPGFDYYVTNDKRNHFKFIKFSHDRRNFDILPIPGDKTRFFNGIENSDGTISYSVTNTCVYREDKKFGK